MSVQTQQMHRRKSSKDDTEALDIMSLPTPQTSPGLLPPPSLNGSTSPRTRTLSSPSNGGRGGHTRSASASVTNGHPPSAGPFRASFQRSPGPSAGFGPVSPLRTSFQMPAPPSLQMNGVNGHAHGGHGRTRSTSTPFSPIAPSPLSSSFPVPPPLPLMTSQSAPGVSLGLPSSTSDELPQPAGSKQPRRHSRIHSRNLSIFFPRPGSLPTSSIAEDGSQEVSVPVDEEAPLIPSAGSSISIPSTRRASSARGPVTPLGQGFTFGGRPKPAPSADASESEQETAPQSTTARRGHHHKHSMSHNFFSFLEPGSGTMPSSADGDAELQTQPTPIPVSPWTPMSAFPDSAKPSQATFQVPPSASNGHAHAQAHRAHTSANVPSISSGGLSTTIAQFVLGSYMWVAGQQVGSLSVTGLGYWVVFDSFGVALKEVVPGWLASGDRKTVESRQVRRPYGNGRVESVLMFAQAVYLMFSSVYVCKETVEHLLLSAGGAEGHHHHPGDEDDGVGIDFPIIMTFITLISLLGTALVFQNNTKIVNITGNRIPSISTFLRSFWSPSSHRSSHDLPPTSPVGVILSNPFVACPILFCISILSVALFVPLTHHRTADLILAALIAVLTFKVAYRASVVLGTVLLQTSPARGLPNGKMEAFLQAMREVERHPQVLHLPAPHMWQLTPSLNSHTLSSTSKEQAAESPLVVTLELHVRDDLADDDVLRLTRWAWEKCVSALGSLKDVREGGEGFYGAEVTVGVVRG